MDKPLGAFDVTVRYDAAVAHAESATGGPRLEHFKFTPVESGLRLQGYYAKGGEPPGESELATISFSRVGPGECALRIEVTAAYDPDGKDMKPAVRLRASPTTLRFR